MIKWLVCAQAALLLAACGPTPLAKHRSITEEMLSSVGSPDFADASTEARAAIRHVPSGMVCLLPLDGTFAFDVFPAQAGNAGAQCSSAVGETASLFMVVKFSAATSLDAAFAHAARETAGRAQASHWRGRPSESDRAAPDGLPHFRIGRFEANIDRTQRYLRVAMSEADGWYMQQIVSAPIADAEAAEAAAGQEWRQALQAFARTPQPSGPQNERR